jgi:SAM-dependent methyltransferase
MNFSDWYALFRFQRRHYGLVRGVLRTFRNDLRRSFSRALIKKYIHQHSRGLELGAGEQTIAPINQTILSDAFQTHAGEVSLAKEFFPAEKIPYEDQKFDFILNEHVLEHVPNAIQALQEWRRVLKPNGVLFLFLPHPKRTFDHFRPITKLEHFLEDAKNKVDSSDDTHWEEWKRLVIDKGLAPHYQRYDKSESLSSNLIHRHVFNIESTEQLLKSLGWTILESIDLVPDRADSFVVVAKAKN